MTDRSDIPADVLRQVEDDAYLDTCDWGYCMKPTCGFGWSDSDAAEEWLTICLSCAEGSFPDANDEPYPVDRVIWLDDIRTALDG